MSSIGLHKFVDVIFGINQKLLYITSSNLGRQYTTNKRIVLNLFSKLKNDGSLVPDPFLFLIIWSIKRGWVKKIIKLTFYAF